MLKKWNQKTLAQKTNIKEDLIKKYENGSALPTPQICNKLRKVLEIF